jgi:ABC-type transporter lipoprotein component MlaA
MRVKFVRTNTLEVAAIWFATRAKVAFRYHATGSPFEYELMRFVYTARRKLETARYLPKGNCGSTIGNLSIPLIAITKLQSFGIKCCASFRL